MNSIVLALSVLSALLAQQPDGETLIKRMAEAASKRQSIQFVMTADIQVMQDGKLVTPRSGSTRTTITFANPGKLRIEEQGVTGERLQISDGSTTWTHDRRSKQYSKSAIGARLSTLGLPVLGWLGQWPVSEIEPRPRIVRDEVIDIGGKPRDCWVVAGTLRISASQAFPAVMTSWIDKKEFVALKHEASFEQDVNNSTKISMVVESMEIDATIPAETFTFRPPQDSREVSWLPGLPRPDLTGTIAPTFEAEDLDGVTYSRDSLKEKPVLLDFWASWCGPCRNSVPELERIHKEFPELVMLAVDVGEDRKVVEAFLKPRPLPYPVILGTEFGLERTFQVSAYPTFILIGRDGRIAGQQIGYSEEIGLRSMVAARLNGSLATSGNTLANTPTSDVPSPAPLPYAPAAVAVDRSGNLYVADSSGARVLKVTPEGYAVVVAGTGIPGNGQDGVQAIFSQLNQPTALAVDAGGNLYIAEAGAGRIRKVTPDGNITAVPGATQLRRIGGLALDGAGNIYFSETANHRVRKVTPDGAINTVAGIGTPGAKGDGGAATSAQLASPRGLAVDNDGNLYIADSGNHRVRKVTSDGTIVLLAGSGAAGISGDGGLAVFAQLKSPSAVAMDNVGSVYVADSSDYRIRKITADGMIETVAETGAAGAGGTNGVSGIALSSNGALYVADTANGRILKIAPDGMVSTAPGTRPEAPGAVGPSQDPNR